MHITNIDANAVGRRRRNAQLIQTLVNDGLVDPSLIANISNLKSYLLTQAENAGTLSTTGQVNFVDFVVGFDLTDVTADEVKDAIITVLNNIQVEPITNSTEIPTAIVVCLFYSFLFCFICRTWLKIYFLKTFATLSKSLEEIDLKYILDSNPYTNPRSN